MFEDQTYEAIMKRCLARVPNTFDKRQGAIIWDALGPACAELAQMYIELDHILLITFAETSYGEWLEKRCSEMGIHREPAAYAVRLGLFYDSSGTNQEPVDIPIGSRWNLEDLNYTSDKRLEKGRYEMICETPGIVGNQLFGALIPMETVPDVGYAVMADVLVPGEDEESDERLYYRYEEAVNTTPYGGNIDDYRQKVRKMEGVGDCKVIPVWNGGGTVKVILIAADWSQPSENLIARVQEELDPVPENQQGRGVAPIGHWVTVEGCEPVVIDVTMELVMRPGSTTIGMIEMDVIEIIQGYLLELRKEWSDLSPGYATVVRFNQIENRVMDIREILDITNTQINGITGNIALAENQIPVIREVVLFG
jgi:uncharacterized phage protein gp47/JayE